MPYLSIQQFRQFTILGTISRILGSEFMFWPFFWLRIRSVSPVGYELASTSFFLFFFCFFFPSDFCKLIVKRLFIKCLLVVMKPLWFRTWYMWIRLVICLFFLTCLFPRFIFCISFSCSFCFLLLIGLFLSFSSCYDLCFSVLLCFLFPSIILQIFLICSFECTIKDSFLGRDWICLRWLWSLIHCC